MRTSRLLMIARLSHLSGLSRLRAAGHLRLPLPGRIAAAFVLALALFAGGSRTAQATPVVYQFTAGSYTGWLSFDPATAILDPGYLTGTSAVYRDTITNMYGTLGDGTNFNTFELATVVLYGAAGYYGLEFSGVSQWGHVDIDMFYFGDYQPLTGTGLPLAIDQTGLTVSVYIGGTQASNTSQQPDPVIQVSNGAPPVPEPSTLLLMGLGLIGLAAFRKRLGLSTT